jgi:hypothetical protein
VRTLEITDEGPGLAEIVGLLQNEPLVLTREGRPLAVLLPVKGAALETVSLSLNPQFQAIMLESAKRQHAAGGISTEEMRRRLGMEPTEPAPSGRGKKAPRKRTG